ncbi:MAG: nucleoside-diphosphate sugar epimerase/dehydratase [Clostridiales bacterium]
MKSKQIVFIIGDILLSATAIYFAVWLRFEGLIAAEYQPLLGLYYLIAACTIVPAGFLFGTYQSMLEYMGFVDAFRQIGAVTASAAVFFVIKYTGLLQVSGSITVIYFGIALMLTTGIRLIPRFRHFLFMHNNGGSKRTLIIGAGTTGAMVIKRLEENGEEGLYPVVAVDDDPAKLKMRVAGVHVAGSLKDIPKVAQQYKAEEAILAIPSINTEAITEIYHRCTACGLKFRIFQSTVDMESYLAGDRKALKQISLEDLLFRDSVRLDKNLIFQCLKDNRILVTGGAGSIGSEICRQALANGCRQLIIYDFNENGLFGINEELKKKYEEDRFQVCLGSIRDKERLQEVFNKYRPQVVFHAAAHKHVPMMEGNPFEAVKNNIIGTENVLQSCRAHQVERCILISTDKAVNPSSIMGATKRAAELLVQGLNSPQCRMAAVRFGNVLGSKGSVVPIFKKQIEEGGPITVTHQDMERYFITIPEAVSLIMVAATLAEGGEIFALDMGKPVKIDMLARELIRLSGLEPDKDIKIEYVGIRPGEKMAEEIYWDEEKVIKTVQEKLFVMRSQPMDYEAFALSLNKVKELVLAGQGEECLKEELMAAIGC